MNKARKALLVSTIVATSLFSKVSDAVANTLKANDKKDFQTEQISEITDHTANSISMNLDNTIPDTSDVKNLFLTPGFLDANELKEFNTLRNNATKSPIRLYYEEEILDVFSENRYNIEKIILILAILDPTQQTSLGKRAMEEINKSTIYQYEIQQILFLMQKKQKNEEQRQKNEEQRQKNEEFKKLIQALEGMEKIFQESQKK